MKRIKRFLAILAVAVIIGLYLVTLLCAIFVKQVTNTLFLASIVATVMVPLLFYLLFWLCNMFQSGEKEKSVRQEQKTRKGFAEAAAFNQREKQIEKDGKQDGNTGL